MAARLSGVVRHNEVHFRELVIHVKSIRSSRANNQNREPKEKINLPTSSALVLSTSHIIALAQRDETHPRMDTVIRLNAAFTPS